MIAQLLSLGLIIPAYSQTTQSLWLPDSVEIQFTEIASGAFLMGSPVDEEGRDKDESPQREIELGSFWMGTFEVTQAQWLSVMGYNPAVFKQKVNHLSFPVEMVSWQECMIFIQKLNKLGMGTFRLPTEEEWEYACRAGTETHYYWGDFKGEWHVSKQAWINSRSMGTTHPVGSKPPNPWGLYDMAGNVWEWTSTTYGKYDGTTENDSLKVFRGGSWFDFAKSQRSANRHKHRLDEKYSTIGLRLVWRDE